MRRRPLSSLFVIATICALAPFALRSEITTSRFVS
jgi:hypothetical protein